MQELSLWSLLGTSGLIAIEASYVPQIVRLFRLRRADHLSLLFPGLNLLGRLAALAYALHIGDGVFSFGLVIGVALRLVLFLQVLGYRAPREVTT